jgi:dipeptidyl aminopeptidase/acylaminoacyl peptidase
MEAAMRKVGIDVRLIRLPGGGHSFGGDAAKHPDWPDFLGETVRWLDRHL